MLYASPTCDAIQVEQISFCYFHEGSFFFANAISHILSHFANNKGGRYCSLLNFVLTI